MQAGKALKTAAAFMLSVAMLATGAACGTSDDSDASASKSSSKSSELTGYDVSGVKKGNPNKVDTSDLCGKKVAVQTATMQETAANKMAKQCKADGKAEMDVISSKLQTDVTTNVVTGKADVFYADSPVAGYAIAQTDGELETLGKTEGIAPEGIVVKKGDQQMDEALQKALQKLIDDGTYMKILKYWGVQDGAISKPEINTPGTNE